MSAHTQQQFARLRQGQELLTFTNAWDVGQRR
jgi:hypothetical protein